MQVTREPEYLPPAAGVTGALGRRALLTCRGAGRGALLLAHGVMSIRHAFCATARHEIVAQMFVSGIKTLGVTTVVAAFTGMILALQTGIQLRQYGREVYIGSAVMVSMLREMGPFMTGLIVAASVGSAIAAQIGTMTISEEVAALELMSIDPVRFLVMPRLVALAVMTPALSMYSVVMGVLGGAIVGMSQLGLSWTAYFDNATLFIHNKDVFVGLLKAFFFGLIIATVASHQGFETRNGAVGVGHATRRTVVVSFLTILVVGYFVTRMFYV